MTKLKEVNMKYIFLCKKCYDPVTPKVPCVNCGSKRDIILRKGPSGWKDMRTTEEYKKVTPRQGQRILGKIRDEVSGD